MPITGSDLALMQARVNLMRVGASRVGYYAPTVVVLIGGVDRTADVEYESIRITQVLNDEPDTATFTILPTASFTPIAGESVVIGLGSSANREFAGQINVVGHQRVQGVDTPWRQVTCLDYGRLFDRRLVTKVWLSVSASAIADDILANYTSGFTGMGIVRELPTIEYFPATNARPTELFRRLGALVGGAFYIDYDRDVHLFGTAGETRVASPPQTLTTSLATHLQFGHRYDPTQIRTRVTVQGMGTEVLAALAAGETVIPVKTAEIFNADGGEAIVEQELVTYTGVEDGGDGSLVGPGVAPPSRLVTTPQVGAGIDAGQHYWAYTWVTGSGETLPSPAWVDGIGATGGPSTAPTTVAINGSGLGVGAYQYAVTFVAGAGETPAGPISDEDTDNGPDDPTGSFSADEFGSGPNGSGAYASGDTIQYKMTWVCSEGGETNEINSGSFTAQDYAFTANPRANAISGLPVSDDDRVAEKRLYRYVNGTVNAYIDIPNGQTTYNDSAFGTATGSFPIEGGPEQRRIRLTNIPIGYSGITARRIYRTVVDGSQLKLVTTINDNSTTTYTDSTADGSLGADVPTTSTTNFSQCALSAIAVGPSGVTSRKVYRSAAGQTQLKLLTTLADNTTTTYTDTSADSALGANVPTSDTSGLSTTTGQVNAGATSMLVAGPGLFSSGGGWAQVNGQTIRYTAVSSTSLTGIPETGDGALQSTVNYGSTVSQAPQLTGIPATGTGSLTHAITKGAAIHLRVTRDDTLAQAVVAAVEGGDGIHEHVVVERRLSEDGAIERAEAELDAFGAVLAEAEWETEDLNAKVGRPQAIAITGDDAIAATLTITRVNLEFPLVNHRPTRRCQASTIKTARLLDVVQTEEGQ